ncbi:MAG: fimbrillin family protein [Bacteroidales bacterium]|nr:fimbrillin family protein [Bacteroidales bacterium]
MKKTILFAFILAAAVSCAKEGTLPLQNAENDTLLNPVTLTFSATVDDAKTTLGEGGAVSFENGDQVKILCLDSQGAVKSVTASVSVSQGAATISATLEDSDNYYAVYPASLTAILAQDGTLTVTDPVSQGGTFSSASLCAAKTGKAELTFNFKHIVSLLKFEVDRTDIASVDIIAKGGVNLTGNLVCTFSGDAVTVTGGSEPSINVTLSGAGTYYAAVSPTAEASALALRMNKTGEIIPAVNVAPKSAIKFERATVKNLGRIDDRVVTDYYISTDGIGTGLSADSYAPVSLMRSLITGAELYYNWIVAGTTFRLKTGTTYVLQSAFNVKPTVPSPFTIVGIGGKAVFSGNKKCQLFNMENADVTLQSLTLQDALSVNGGALYMNGVKLTVDDCMFQRDTASTCAGVLYATGNSDVDFSNCSIWNNGSKGPSNAPSCFMLWGNAFLKLNNCYISGNTASNRAAINAQGTSVVFINACAFNGNKNAAATTYASAIHAGGNGVCINNSTFYQNNGKSSNAPLTNCESITAAANMIIANTTFYEYFQANRGVICATAAKKGILFNNIILNNYSGCVFYFSSAGYKFTSCGYNIYRTITDYRTGDAKIGIPAATGDISGVAATVLSGASWDSTKHVYSWNGSLTSGSLVKASSAEFEEAVKSMGETVSNTVIGSGKKLGTEFWNWLVSIDATTTDQLGTSRGTTDWWPGSYQN